LFWVIHCLLKQLLFDFQGSGCNEKQPEFSFSFPFQSSYFTWKSIELNVLFMFPLHFVLHSFF
jgi:hypothetical protein